MWNTTHLTFTSGDHIHIVIAEAMDRVNDYFSRSPSFDVPERVFVKDKIEVMELAYREFK